jgi:pimeloyl-ACP methyl ester carboxylesterase
MMADFVTSPDGTRIAYERSGTGIPLLLVHGGFVDRGIWQQVTPALAQHFTVYAMDRRGHGQSGPYRPGHTLKDEYADVAAMIEAIGEPLYLLGYSAGGPVALGAAWQRPGQVRKLVLYEPARLGAGMLTADLRQRLEAGLAAGDWDGLVRIALMEVVGGLHAASGERIRVREDFRHSLLWQNALHNAAAIPAELESLAAARYDLQALRRLNVPPTLLLVGSQSPPRNREPAETLLAALPHARLEALPGQSHGAMFTAPGLFAERVIKFLSE